MESFFKIKSISANHNLSKGFYLPPRWSRVINHKCFVKLAVFKSFIAQLSLKAAMKHVSKTFFAVNFRLPVQNVIFVKNRTATTLNSLFDLSGYLLQKNNEVGEPLI